MRKRGVPEANLLRITTHNRESLNWDQYREQVEAPVREYLASRKSDPAIRCVLLMYGIPLRVRGSGATREEAQRLRKLGQRKSRLEARLEQSGEGEGQDLRRELEETDKALRLERRRLNKSASLDSELALLPAGDSSRSMWARNPYCLIYGRDAELALSRDQVLLTCRLDGPSPQVVKRMVEDSLHAEKEGLSGTAYFDARWEKSDRERVRGYKRYDKSLHAAAKRLREQPGLKVVLENTSELFQPGDCPSAALYCGWYSLGRYVDAFEWERGAVGYHIASSECATLRGESQVWCKRILEDGAAATLGPVDEPYVQAFPLPELFFGLLVDGHLSLAEVYALATPYWSWKMVLVGDPLYSPFAQAGAVEEEPLAGQGLWFGWR
jgi:uncharacterized protein (TIGR03790 family)